MTEKYSSIPETEAHRIKVDEVIHRLVIALEDRAIKHDDSKERSPEVEVFDVETPKLKQLVYGSQEYKDSLARLGPALEHHYKANRHHPEHFDNGVDGMTLVDLVEMFCDWMAASKRTKNGNPMKSVEVSVERFKIDPQLASILANTVAAYFWEEEENAC